MALQPSNTTVIVDQNKFNAESVHVGIETLQHDNGMPMMGASRYIFDCSVDAHDTTNLPFSMLSRLYELANIVNRTKIVEITIEFWQDDSQKDVICSFHFFGWLSDFHISSGNKGNHTVHLAFVPRLDKNQFVNVKMGN